MSGYSFTLYHRATGWRQAPELRIVVVSEPLGTITRGIASEVADVQVLPYPLTGTGDRLAAEHLLGAAHVLILPRAADAEGLPILETTRRISVEGVFPQSFQYQLLTNNRQFFTYASQELEEKVAAAVRDGLVDVDVVRAGKYEVATKKLRDRIRNEGL